MANCIRCRMLGVLGTLALTLALLSTNTTSSWTMYQPKIGEKV
ncbi:MAG: cyclic lactone autoinducer peptide [Clostridioides sp.]|nr:cyclic lactone autoinducer peptide [Clostridioides sp.]